jgi:hypothetical protein
VIKELSHVLLVGNNHIINIKGWAAVRRRDYSPSLQTFSRTSLG